MNRKGLIFLVLISILTVSPIFSQKMEVGDLKELSDRIVGELEGRNLIPYNSNIAIDSAIVKKDDKLIDIYFSKEIAYLPIREKWLLNFEEVVRNSQKRKIRKRYKINSYSGSKLLTYYIPNFYRESNPSDSLRFDSRESNNIVHIVNESNPTQPTSGLQNKHIAIWGGHGQYYAQKDSLWQWQRPNLFTTVEDFYTYSYVVPYIIPMLEKAGANVYYPKERDTQTQELIVDLDSDSSKVIKTKGVLDVIGGFALRETYADYENPFKLGTHHQMKTTSSSGIEDSIVYKITNLEKGDFAVYVSYNKSDESVTDVEYEVFHDGGKTVFRVNQQMGFDTWVYLGEFHFGISNNSKIIVKNNSKFKGEITSDAIKLGGGFNRIMRNGTLSKMPSYLNAARYYLQYSGMPDSSVYSLTNYTDDYKDDYKSRGEWVNYLLGQPYSANRDSSLQGLNIPLDMSLAFHTDASTTKTDSVVGTLTIHSTKGLNGEQIFPDGRSRYSNRDLADIVHTEIVKTIHQKYNPEWVRRPMWDKQYSEATYPNVPSILIELLSHQNFGDMKYGLDPNFKFDVSRSIYKGILKYLTSVNNQSYIVSPLAINSFSVIYKDEKLVLNWKQTIDELEKTAKADAYVVYTKVGDGGFDNGILVKGSSYEFVDFELGKQYSFKVKAVNNGGVSFDSEILSACIFNKKDNPVLIVNAFDKVSAPEYYDTDSLGGFSDWKKSAIAYGIDISYTGNQYNFDKNKPWITNPLTGHGASYSNYEGKQVCGNTFNYPFIHGKFFAKRNISFVSTSIKAFEDNVALYSHFDKIDLIYGKQSIYKSVASKRDYSIFNESTRGAISTWLAKDKSILVSGAFVGSDVFLENSNDTDRVDWVKDNFNYNIVTDKASVSGEFRNKETKFRVNKEPMGRMYELRSLDALSRVGDGVNLFRYSENNYSVGVYSNLNNYKTLVLGIPIGNVIENQDKLWDEIIDMLKW